MIILAADHGGWAMKQKIRQWLASTGLVVEDLSPARHVGDDYPVIARQIAQQLKQHPVALAIAVCRSGVGFAIATNKLPGMRAVQGWSPAVAAAARKEEAANILSLAADHQTFHEMHTIISAWLRAKPSSLVRHRRRRTQLTNLEHGRTR